MYNYVQGKYMKTNKNRQIFRKLILFISFILFPITIYYLSPVLPLMGLANRIINASLIIFGILFILSLFLGRAFCGWFCPGGAIGDICSLIYDRKKKPVYYVKWIIWFLWIGLYLYLLISLNFNIGKIDFFFQIPNGISILNPQAIIIYYFFVTLILVFSFLITKRGFCHYICWMAPFMIIGNKIRFALKISSLKLKADKTKCISCGICNAKCPMQLNVQSMVLNEKMNNTECILCGECIDNCPKNTIFYIFR